MRVVYAIRTQNSACSCFLLYLNRVALDLFSKPISSKARPLFYLRTAGITTYNTLDERNHFKYHITYKILQSPSLPNL